MEKQFENILEKDEVIVKAMKPNKRKFWASAILLTLVSAGWGYFILLGSIPEEGESFDARLFWILFGVATGILALALIIVRIFGGLYYKNRVYGYTNKRILIRSGIIGVDYKSLEFQHLTATVVNVGVVDKIVRQNTGSIRFGSPSSPISGSGAEMANPYNFAHIEKPYDVMREIKEYIDRQEEKATKKKK